MTDHPTQPKQTEAAYFWALAKALLWSALAASITIEVFSAMAPYPLALGFVAGIVFSVVMAYCNHRNRERFGRGFFSFPQ
jgi:Flp pilus assembly protein TadB